MQKQLELSETYGKLLECGLFNPCRSCLYPTFTLSGTKFWIPCYTGFYEALNFLARDKAGVEAVVLLSGQWSISCEVNLIKHIPYREYM